MRNLIWLIAVLLIAVSCSTTRKVEQRSVTEASEVRDSSRYYQRATHTTVEVKESENKRTERSDEVEVAFVDGGGVVEVDSDGRVTLQGVASLRGSHLRGSESSVDRDGVIVVLDTASVAEVDSCRTTANESHEETTTTTTPTTTFRVAELLIALCGVAVCFVVVFFSNLKK